MTAPTIPTACNKAFGSQSSHHGVNIPFRTSIWLGAEIIYCNLWKI